MLSTSCVTASLVVQLHLCLLTLTLNQQITVTVVLANTSSVVRVKTSWRTKKEILSMFMDKNGRPLERQRRGSDGRSQHPTDDERGCIYQSSHVIRFLQSRLSATTL